MERNLLFLIDYDLRAPGRDYSSLYAELQSFAGWAHPLESTWVIRSTSTASAVRDRLRAHLDANDGLLVVEAGSSAAWYGLSDEVGKWLLEHVGKVPA